MPIHPGILLSSLLVVACLGMNIALYPEVREMLHGVGDTAVKAAAPTAAMSKGSPDEPPKPVYPELEKSEAKPSKPVTVKKTETEPTPKSSKVNRPITVPVDEEKKSKETKQAPEKKPEEKKPGPKEEPKSEKPKPVAEKPVEPVKKDEEKKVEEKKPESASVKKEEPKSIETKQEAEPKPKDGTYGLPSVFPPDAPEPKKEAPEKDAAAAFQPLVPSELEKDYREAEGRRINQAVFPPPRVLPTLRQPVSPEQAAPLYAAPYQARTINPEPEYGDPTAPIRKLPTIEAAPAIPIQPVMPPPVEVKRPERKPPKMVWDTAETIMERPIIYE